MVLEYYDKDKLATRIVADEETRELQIENFTDNIFSRAFGRNEEPTWKEFMEFLERRCFPRSRNRMDICLKELGLTEYNPLAICKKTEGRMAEDSCHIRFVEE
jgi:hypothetical protein